MFERSEAQSVCPDTSPDRLSDGKSGREGQTDRSGGSLYTAHACV